MKSRFGLLKLSCLVLAIMMFLSCRKTVYPPVVSKTYVNYITEHRAGVESYIIWDGESYITECGFCYNTTGNPTIGDWNVEANHHNNRLTFYLNNLQEGTKYYIRSYVKNARELSYGAVNSFTTIAYKAPSISSPGVSDLTNNSVICQAFVTHDNSDATVSRGFCWSASTRSPTLIDEHTVDDEPGIGSFFYKITNLTPGTVYYIRAYASNSAGISYSGIRTIRTYDGMVKDSDGNTYLTSRIGNQEWMIRSLYTTHFNNGDPIATTNPAILNIVDEIKPVYQWLYYRAESYPEYYGRLYTWYTATDPRGICPEGWHLPKVDEYKVLLDNFGGQEIKSSKITTLNSNNWMTSSGSLETNPGFGATLSGYRTADGQFNQRSYSGRYWSTSDAEQGDVYALLCGVEWEQITFTATRKNWAYSIRCLKDQ